MDSNVLSTGHRGNTTVNALEDPADIFSARIQLKSEIAANTELSGWVKLLLASMMKTRRAMAVFIPHLHQAHAMAVLILRCGADLLEMLEKLKGLETMSERDGSFICKFKLVCEEYEKLTVLADLRQRKRDLNDKLERIQARRNAWNTAMLISKFGVTALSVVFPVVGVWPAVTAANNGATGVTGILQSLVDSHLAGKESSCKDERDLTAKILDEASFVFHRVNSVRVLVENLEVQMEVLAQDAADAEFLAGKDEDVAVSMAMEKIKSKAGEFVDSIENLKKEMDRSCEDLRRAALTLLQTDQKFQAP